MRHLTFALAGLFMGLLATAASAVDLEPIDADAVKQYAAHLSEKVAEVKEQQVKVEPDAERATGLHYERDGMIIVPSKSVKEGEIDPAVDSETGAPLAYLFLSPRFNPVVDGKPIDAKKLRTVKFTDGEGNERDVTVLILTARRLDGESWKLYVYGEPKEPLVESSWYESTENTEGAIALRIFDAKEDSARLILTLFNRYSSDFRIGYKFD